MKIFNPAFVIGPTDNCRSLIESIEVAAPDLSLMWLASYDKLRGKSDFHTEFGVREGYFSGSILDNGAYSMGQCNTTHERLNVMNLAKAYENSGFGICIAPDAPFPYLPYSKQLYSNLIRHEEFYEVYQPRNGTLIYNVVHGQVLESKKFLLDYREEWIDRVNKVSQGKVDGLAIKLRHDEIRNDQRAYSYFAMQPWARGTRNCHLLMAGALEMLPLYVYLGRRCYDRFSIDATNFTTKVMEGGAYVSLVGGRRPKFIPLKEKEYRPEKMGTVCECPVCIHFLDQYGGISLKELIAFKHSNKAVDRNDRLHRWVMAHNVYVVKRYLDDLFELSADYDEFLRFIREEGFTGIAEIDGGVDGVIDNVRFVEEVAGRGPSSYSGFIDQLNNS